jgi:hypothetical protein
MNIPTLAALIKGISDWHLIEDLFLVAIGLFSL